MPKWHHVVSSWFQGHPARTTHPQPPHRSTSCHLSSLRCRPDQNRFAHILDTIHVWYVGYGYGWCIGYVNNLSFAVYDTKYTMYPIHLGDIYCCTFPMMHPSQNTERSSKLLPVSLCSITPQIHGDSIINKKPWVRESFSGLAILHVYYIYVLYLYTYSIYTAPQISNT